jgi:hypothetical protein
MDRHDGKSRGESGHSSKCDRSEYKSDHERIMSNSHKDRQQKHRARRYESDSDSESDDSTEKQRIKDLKERDEFADRLKKKDKEKTRNVAQSSGSGEYSPVFQVNHEDMEYRNQSGA